MEKKIKLTSLYFIHLDNVFQYFVFKLSVIVVYQSNILLISLVSVGILASKGDVDSTPNQVKIKEIFFFS